MRGRGKEEACREAKRVHVDFMFMGDEGEDRTLAVLLVKERGRGIVMATVAPRKSRAMVGKARPGVHEGSGLRRRGA